MTVNQKSPSTIMPKIDSANQAKSSTTITPTTCFSVLHATVAATALPSRNTESVLLDRVLGVGCAAVHVVARAVKISALQVGLRLVASALNWKSLLSVAAPISSLGLPITSWFGLFLVYTTRQLARPPQ
jgi:hypothetical protein